ncbi:MAG: deoxyribodipyrimidine photo-lyase [Bacteroidales bacterium]|jgi:deoxyribodipyrimidine photo-lyase|nr:deoxyribodipyrimidine photo-lyase [Bacteroidales bacterium]HPJ82654.1 deoxyribodipyrimidine photo-lyase [Bacteroidales bacterium]
MEKVSVFWFRRDLRLEDNLGMQEALSGPFPVLPLFIFDDNILDELEANDPRVTFIHDRLAYLNQTIEQRSGAAAASGTVPGFHDEGTGFGKLYCKKGTPREVWMALLDQFSVGAVYANEDYEPYAISRDREIEGLLAQKGVPFHLFKDQVIFARDEVIKKDGTPYTLFTPYKNAWVRKYAEQHVRPLQDPLQDLLPVRLAGYSFHFPSLAELGFKRSSLKVRDYDINNLDNYGKDRNYPALDGTSHLSVHLRFGTVSIRSIVSRTAHNQSFLNELIWREFFMQVLYHFPDVVGSNFRKKFDKITWRNDPADFEKWQKGETGHLLVDAGMRELNATGYMHNRVRMVVADYLCKHLLIDWRWGEAYFATKLLDYELSSNNGNWQWAAGTGCDATPYFRKFNTAVQLRKFDPQMIYVKKWIPEARLLKK